MKSGIFRFLPTLLPLIWCPWSPSHLSLLPLLFEGLLLAAAQLPPGVGQLHLQLGQAPVHGGGALAALGQVLIGPIQQLLELRRPVTVVMGVDGAVGKSLFSGATDKKQ